MTRGDNDGSLAVTARDVRNPYTTCVNMSWLRSSVPNRCAALGPCMTVAGQWRRVNTWRTGEQQRPRRQEQQQQSDTEEAAWLILNEPAHVFRSPRRPKSDIGSKQRRVEHRHLSALLSRHPGVQPGRGQVGEQAPRMNSAATTRTPACTTV